MSLKIDKEDFSGSRLKRAVPIFFLLFAGSMLLCLFYLLSVRSHLHTLERGHAEKLLDLYLTLDHSASPFYDSHLLPHDRMLQGLAFVRIMQGGDQMLAVGDRIGSVNFTGLMTLDPGTSGVWLKIGKGREAQLLTVIVRNYDNGVSIQAGVDGRSGNALFRDLIQKTIYILLASGAGLGILSIYLVKLGLAPLVNTRNMISGLVRGGSTELLPAHGRGPELDSLHEQINKLVDQNRHLVLEMQQSLDNVAHDLRTPMTRLRSVAEYGLQADGDVERLRESLSDCLEESERVLSMLKIMMSVAEAESGTMLLELQEGDLADSLAQVVTLYEYVAEEKNITLSLSDVTSVVIRVDQTRISQVWANLVDNGIKYGREGGWLKIAVKADKRDVVVTFEDNGMGISENEQSRIWERLYRGDRSRSQQGLGLGLNYVQAVVAAHGGTVTVTSRLHHGSRFAVRLPLSRVSGQN